MDSLAATTGFFGFALTSLVLFGLQRTFFGFAVISNCGFASYRFFVFYLLWGVELSEIFSLALYVDYLSLGPFSFSFCHSFPFWVFLAF